ncbi:hypothetical protein [Deinococcus altitudinis]|uniref:hypothetical protein n=1 Tax=Deinococcus altitudinis TaxID=468914 RepID=UPI003891932A
MSDELKDTTPLGKSVEEIEGEPQLRHPNDSLVGRIMNPEPTENQDTTTEPSLINSFERAVGMDTAENSRNPDADIDSSEE